VEESLEAAGELVQALHGELFGYTFMIEVLADEGRKRLGDAPIQIIAHI